MSKPIIPTDKVFVDTVLKYIKILGTGENECLVFKGISSKRNKEDFELIKSLVKGNRVI